MEPGPDGNWIHSYHGKATDSTNILNDTYGEITGVPDIDVLEMGQAGGPPPIFVHHYYASGVRHAWSYPDGSTTTATVEAPLTQMKLYTGGKAGIKRKSLIHINASALQYGKSHAPPSNTPWLHTPTEDVQATKIQVLGKQLGNDGRLYIVLPDNEDMDLNLNVPGPKHYGAWASATKHRLNIAANGYFLAEDRVRPGAKYCVGQYIEFSPLFVPALPEEPEKDVLWSFDGELVNKVTPPQYSDGSSGYVKDANLLRNETTHCWWVSGNFDPPAEYGARINEHLSFANGQYVSISARGKLSMHRPRLVNFTHSLNANNRAVLQSHGLPSDFDEGPLETHILHYHAAGGSPFAPDGVHSVDYMALFPPAFFSVQCETIPVFNGNGALTQVIQGGSYVQRTIDPVTWTFRTLDNREFYFGPVAVSSGTLDGVKNMLCFYDQPNFVCNGDYNATHQDFINYIRFQPAGGPGPNIYVTLAFVRWHEYGSTTAIIIPGSNPSIKDYSPFPEGDLEMRPTFDSDAGWDSGLVDTHIFPFWVHTFTNY